MKRPGGLPDGILLAIVIAAVLCVYLATITDGMPATSTDWAMYVMHARNILHGRPYTETGYIVQPETLFEGANSYPSGLPLMLVPVYAAVGFSVRAFKIFCDSALALSLWPIYLFCRRLLSARSSMLIVLATSFSWLYVSTRNTINSESPYQFLSFACIPFILWVYQRGKDKSPQGWLWGLSAGLALAACYVTRPIGLAIVLAVVVADIVRRRRVSVFIGFLLLTFGAVLFLNNWVFHKDGAYKDQFVLSPILIARHVITNLAYLSYPFASPLLNIFRYVLWGPALFLAVLGVLSSVRRFGITVVEYYGVIVFGVISVYWLPNPRYLLPVMPIFLVYVLLGFEAALERVPARYRPGLRWAAAGLLLFAPAVNLLRIQTFNQESLIATTAFNRLCRQIAAQTGVHDYVLFWNPRVLALYTERSSSPYPLADPQQVQRYIDRVKPNYIVLEKDWEDDRKYLAPVLDLQPKRYVNIFENEKFRLERVVEPGVR